MSEVIVDINYNAREQEVTTVLTFAGIDKKSAEQTILGIVKDLRTKYNLKIGKKRYNKGY